MRLSTQIKPVSYLEAHAEEIVQDLGRDGEPLIITVNGEAKAIIQSMAEYERTQEAIALMKIIELGDKKFDAGEGIPASEVFAELRRKKGF